MVSSGRPAIACVLLIFGVAIFSQAQTTPAKEPTASISGKVTLKGKGMPGIVVIVSDPNRGYAMPSYRAATDASGNYRISNIPEGTYRVSPHVLAFAVENQEATNRVNVADGETIEDINFVLVKGGVITGKITDSDGQPLIEQQVTLQLFNDERGMSISYFPYHTDDRGVYRAFGLRAGKYKVFAGNDVYDRLPLPGRAALAYTKTFYPSITDEAKAQVIEVSEGSETKDVDIAMASRAPGGFRVSGRIIHGETGKPLPNVVYGISQHQDGNTSSTSGARSNADGEFKFDNVLPGKYSVFIQAEHNSQTRSNSVPFEVTDHDITGLVVKSVKGASVSGVVVLEGSDEKTLSKKLSELHVFAIIENSDEHIWHGASAVSLKPDGSFTLNGLRAGTAKIEVSSMSPYGSRDLSIVRVERDGIVQPSGIPIKEGEHIQGIRLITKYLTGAIRGQLKIEGGELPSSATMFVLIALANDDPNTNRTEQIDSRRRFFANGLAAGRYTVTAHVYIPGRVLDPNETKQEVTVLDNTVTEVVLTVKLKTAPDDDDDDP